MQTADMASGAAITLVTPRVEIMVSGFEPANATILREHSEDTTADQS